MSNEDKALTFLQDFCAENDMSHLIRQPIMDIIPRIFDNVPRGDNGRPVISELIDNVRAVLRLEIMRLKMIGEENIPLTSQGYFSGSGDSGSYDICTGMPAVDLFLEKMLDIHVTFDWYNNDGGGGDITWDVMTDKITINGYTNVINEVTEMHGEEF